MPEDRFDAAPGGAAGRLTVGEALRALPLEQPPRSAWPQLRQALSAPPRRRRTPWLLAAAALLLAALALPRLLAPTIPSAPTDAGIAAHAPAPTAAPDDVSTLPALVAESAQLEALLAVTGDQDVADGASLLLRARLQQRLQYVDLLLAESARDPSAQLPLWQERVVLMRHLAGLQSGGQLLAAHGDAADSPMVLAF